MLCARYVKIGIYIWILMRVDNYNINENAYFTLLQFATETLVRHYLFTHDVHFSLEKLLNARARRI